jgi:tripartite-type tricarboxylate transporter receptor subunit TctC
MLATTMLAAALGLASTARAGPFPTPGKPVRIIVGFPAGGGTDFQARLIAQYLTPLLGVPVVIENHPGAGTVLAATEVVRSAPDGHTLLYTPSNTLALLPNTLLAVKYDTFKDFTPVAEAALGPNVLVVHKSIPATNVRELVAYAKAHPGELNYVSQGVGTPAHVYGDVLARQTGIDIVHVPYKGANDVAKDFMAGRVQMQFASSTAAVALERSGQARIIGVVSAQRSKLFPDLPTMAEQGVQGIDIESWLGFVGPAGMDPQVTEQLTTAIRQALATPKLREDFLANGAEATWQGPADFGKTIAASYQEWARALRAMNFKKE